MLLFACSRGFAILIWKNCIAVYILLCRFHWLDLHNFSYTPEFRLGSTSRKSARNKQHSNWCWCRFWFWHAHCQGMVLENISTYHIKSSKPNCFWMAFSPLPSPPPIESFKRIALIVVIDLFIIIVHPNSRIAYTHTNHNERINERT